MKSHVRVGLILLTAALIVALAAGAALARDGAPSGSGRSHPDVAGLLTGEGVEIQPQGAIEGGLFEVATESFLVSGDTLLVFRFASDSEARAAADRLHSDGSGIDDVMVRWIAPPHFFLSGDSIILYLGERMDILKILGQEYGPQVAGAN